MIPESYELGERREQLLDNIAGRITDILRNVGAKPSLEKPGTADDRKAWQRVQIYLDLQSELRVSDDKADDILARYARLYPSETFNL